MRPAFRAARGPPIGVLLGEPPLDLLQASSTALPPFAARRASSSSTSASGAIIEWKNETESARKRSVWLALRASGDTMLSVSAMTGDAARRGGVRPRPPSARSTATG